MIELLPFELRQAILECLDLTSIKNFRLASKQYAELGADYLISPSFRAFAHRPDYHRLKSIANEEKFNYRIVSLYLNHAQLNVPHWRRPVFFAPRAWVGSVPSRSDEALNDARHTFTIMDQNSKKNLPTWATSDSFEYVLRRLPYLKSIQVSLMDCPFEEYRPALLKDAWKIPSMRLLPRSDTVDQFTSVLEAVASCASTISIKSLAHDRLPLEFFARNPIQISLLSAAFQSLTTLNLALDYDDASNNLYSPQAFQNLAHCIHTARSLRVFNLEFHEPWDGRRGRMKPDISSLLAHCQVHNGMLSDMGQLSLKGVMCTIYSLATFMIGLKSLERLQLGGPGVKISHEAVEGGCHVRVESLRGWLEHIRHGMLFESFRLNGDSVAFGSGSMLLLEDVINAENV